MRLETLSTVMLVGLGGLLVPAEAVAAPRALARVVKRGETAAGLARRYYGQPAMARALLLANGLDGLARRPPRLRAGATVTIPTSWSYRIRQGDTFATIARDYLGDGAKAGFLAWINGKDMRRGAPAGHVILIPALVKARVRRPMTLKKLAARLLGSKPGSKAVARLVRRVRRYNALAGEPKPGKSIWIPLVRLRLLGWFLPTMLPRKDPGRLRRARAALKMARADLRAGRYLEVALALSPVTGLRGLPRSLLLSAGRLLVTAYVALSRGARALVAARAVLALDPGYRPDPVQTSPKVRAVYLRAAKGGSAATPKVSGN